MSAARAHAQRGIESWMLGLCVLVACCTNTAPESTSPGDAGQSARDGDVGSGASAAAHPVFCNRDRERADAVRSAFCDGPPPSIGSLSELLELLRIPTDPLAADPAPVPSVDGYAIPPGVVVLGHSTALAGHVVSPINPRAIVMGERTIMAYQRGVQRIELATLADGQGTFNFYLLSFEQACNERADGCSPGDLYTPRVESDWLRVEIQDDEDLANTSFDCRQCHQRGRETPILLMREVQSPWTHFFDTLVR